MWAANECLVIAWPFAHRDGGFAKWVIHQKNKVNLDQKKTCKRGGEGSMSRVTDPGSGRTARVKGTMIVAIALCAAFARPSCAAGAIDKDYIRSLAAPGKTVLVIEYYDGQGKIAGRKGYASASGFAAVSPTDFRVDEAVTVHLYGIEPCDGEIVNRQENFAGSCADFAKRGLETLLKSPKVIFCRAFVTEQHAPAQDATCYGYYHYPGSLDTVDMFEEQLVSLGTHRIAKKPDGSPARPDLEQAEKIGRGGFGMWSDPRIKDQ
jgi:hypothetical protein